jgi:hypothetical protein
MGDDYDTPDRLELAYHATSLDKLEVLQYLLQRTSFADLDRHRIIHSTVTSGRLRVVKYLVGSGVDVAAEAEYLLATLASHQLWQNGES